MMGFWDRFDISWTMWKQSALCCRQIATATPHNSVFTGQMLFLTPSQQCQSSEVTVTWAMVSANQFFECWLHLVVRVNCLSGVHQSVCLVYYTDLNAVGQIILHISIYSKYM